MSGIYIPGMEMSTSRPVCIVIDAAGQVRRYDLNNDRYADDKLFEVVPVPDHGRLIDADALYEKFFRLERVAMSVLQTTSIGSVGWIKWSAILTERTGYKFDIVDAPTIIPASKEERDERRIL